MDNDTLQLQHSKREDNINCTSHYIDAYMRTHNESGVETVQKCFRIAF